MVAILVLAGVVLAPIAEELIFRGVLLGWLTKLAVGEKRPVNPDPTIGVIDKPIEPDFGGYLLETVEVDPVEEATEPGLAATSEHPTRNPYEAPFSSIVPRYETVAVDPSGRVFPLLLANITVSLIFAALHGAVWPTPVPIFFLSLGLGLLYQRTGGILASTALHMTFNGVSTLLMFLTLGPAAPKVDPKLPNPTPPPARAQAATVGEISFFSRPVDARAMY